MKKIAGYAVVLILSVQVLSAQAQGPTVTDSLNALIPRTAPQKLNTVFDALCKQFEKMEREDALAAAKQSLERAKDKRNFLAEIFAHRNLGQLYNHYGNKEEALIHYQESVRIARQQSSHKFDLAIALFDLGQFLSWQGLLAEGLQNLLDASRIFESIEAYTYVTLCHVEATTIHYNAQNYQQCLEEGYRVLAFHEKLSESEKTPDSEFQRMSTYNTMGLANKGLQQYDKAIENFEKGEAIARQLNNVFWTGLINGNKAVILKYIGRPDEAIAPLLTDYRISKQFHVWGSAGMAVIALSEIYRDKRDLKKAQQYLDSARLVLANETDGFALQKGLASYWIAFARLKAVTGDHTEAYNATLHHMALRDSLSHDREMLNLAKVKASYDLEQKQKEIELLTRNNEVQQERIRSQKMLFISTLLVLILVAFLAATLVFNFRRQKKIHRLLRQQRDEIETKNMALEAQGVKLQENNQYIQSLNAQLEQKVVARTRELEQSNKELDTFLYHSSHDIRRPITTLLGLEQVSRYATTDEEMTQLFSKVAETARSMDSMLFKMQMVYELNKPDHPVEVTDVEEMIAEVLSHFREDLERHSMASYVSVPPGLQVVSNKILLKIVFRNLLENSIIFRKTGSAGCFVRISVKKENGIFEVSVTDNGIGIKEKYTPKIFDLYFRASQASKGNGLGLYLVQKAVQQLKGRITLVSDFTVGTTFTIQLPVES